MKSLIFLTYLSLISTQLLKITIIYIQNQYITRLPKQQNTKLIKVKRESMSINPVWNAFTNDTKQTESLEIDLKEPHSNRDSTLMLSLSNYLQYDDPSIFYHEKYPENHHNENLQQQQNLIIEKQHPSIQEYSIQQQYPTDQNSESMLLLESEIKPNNEFGAFIEKKLIQCRKQSYQNEHEIQTNQFSAPKTQQTLVHHDKRFFTQSLELLELLSIPKQKVIKQSNGQKYLKEDELKKIKRILEYFQQNKELINNPKLFLKKQDQNIFICEKCISFEKRIISLEQLLASKQKQIRKYEELIDQLNSKAFDLKIQNKRLSFENQQYLNQIQSFLSQNSKIKSKQRLSIISYDNSQNQQFLDEDNNEVSNSSIVSRALPKKSISKQDARPKQEQKVSDSNDQLLKGSIFKFKESQFIEIAERTIDQMLKNNNMNKNGKKKQSKAQTESNIKRFSDILYENKNNKLGVSDEGLTSYSKQPKSPLKKGDFFKEKGKEICQGNNALKQKATENCFQVYKSFKEINELHFQNSQNRKCRDEQVKNNIQSSFKIPYNFNHIERNSSPSFSMKKQNTERQRLYSSPIAKQNKNTRQTQTKALLR